MNLDDIKRILDLVREHELSEFELERDGLKVRVRKGGAAPPAPLTAVEAPVAARTAPSSPHLSASSASPPVLAEADEAEASNVALIKSPIVGTYYQSPSPDAPSFVKVGDQVRKGQVLCIIEAMKLMNEIESDSDGEVTAIYVENGKAVQFGERLFAVKIG